MAPRNRRLARILAWVVGVLLALPVLLASLIYWQKDRLIALVVAQCNERLQTPVRVDKIDLTVWATFPRVAVQMDSVIIQESCEDHKRRLAAIGRVRFGFSPWSILHGSYAIEFLDVRGGYVYMRHLADGTPNYDILKPDSSQSKGGATAFDLKHIRLDSLRYRFVDEGKLPLLVSARIPHAEATLHGEGRLLTIQCKTKGAELHKLAVLKTQLADRLPVRIDSKLEVEVGKEVRFFPATTGIGQAEFLVEGKVGLGPKTGTYHFKLRNEGSSLANLLVLVPADIRKQLEAYRTQGQVYFEGEVASTQRDVRFPMVKASFGARKAQFEHPSYKIPLTGVDLTGTFSLPEGNSLEPAHLVIKQATGQVAGHSFSGALDVINPVKPRASGYGKATLPMAFFGPQLQQAGVTDPAGQMALDVRFETDKAGKIKADGSVGLANVAFKAGARKLAFEGWNGNLALEGEVLKADALSGHIGRSDLALEGRLENLLGFLSGTRPALALEVAIQSRYLDLDELLAAGQAEAAVQQAAAAKAGAEGDYRFVVAPGLRMNATCQVGQMRFRRFSPRSIRGRLTVAGQQMALEGVRFYEVGGLFGVEATVNAAGPLILVDSRYTVDGARMDSLFYVMEDFGQTTLKHTQIQGKLNATGTLSFGVDHGLNIKMPTVVAASDIRLTDGALLYFEPAQALGKFIDKEELKYLKFSDLQNKLTIQNERISIPEMDIRSNLVRVYVRGTHTFNQDMDYHLRIPINYVRRSSLENTRAESGGNLLLAMKGRPGNIHVTPDLPALKDKIANDVQEEKQNFLNLFKRKPKPVKEDVPTSPQDQPPTDEPKKEGGEFMDLD